MSDPTGEAPLAADDELLAGLADDFAARVRRGEHPRVEDYVAKHPALAGRIREVLAAVAMIEHTRPVGATSGGEGQGSTIGRYKLLERIGEGGFGVVYMAEQLAPVRRKVALKVVKPGMDSHQVLARFEAERQALAIMDHPNIARVFDAGATDAGRPYFVMELVKGVPITEFCDQQQLTPRARLELFAQVCHAVQHAHQKGIIHRDIKPSNVLVAMHDTRPVVKVIDFGVAKALGQELTERTLFTGFAQLIGTPLYMSPEQAGQSALDVDTRSDIYSLGVLLYELLTGTTPFDKERFKKAAQDEIRRIIREEEPPKPSTRLSASGGTLASISAQRHTEPAKLTKLVRGELDWIVMKALEKDRSRRYETANGLAMDVQRYLDDDAVQACPPSAVYRLKKFARRNKGPVITAALVLLTLMAGIVGTSFGLMRAEQARRAEARRAESERLAREEAQAREADAKEREAETKAVLDFAEKKVFAAARPQGQAGGLGHDVTLRRAMEAALPFVDESFKDRPLIEARLRVTLAQSFLYLGEARIAASQCEAARALYTKHLGPDHPMTLNSMYLLAASYAELGRYNDAVQLEERTLALRKAKLGPDHLDTLRSMNNLALTYADLGRHAEAVKLQEEMLALAKVKLGPDDPGTLVDMLNLAKSYRELGRNADACKLLEQALALMKAKLGLNHRTTFHTMANLAIVYDNLGRHADALTLNEELVALRKANLGPDHPDTLASMGSLANTYADLGRKAEALKLREQVLALEKAKLGVAHPYTVATMNNLSASYAQQGRYAEALKLSEEVFAQRKASLPPDHPETLLAMSNLGQLLLACQRDAEALPLIDECVRRAMDQDVRPTFLPELIWARLRHFEKAKDASGCRTSAEMFEQLKLTKPVELYNAACYRAVTARVFSESGSPGAPAEATVEAQRAMEWLSKAIAAGYSSVAYLKGDKDLDALRGREDFRKLIENVRAKPDQAIAAAREALRSQPQATTQRSGLKKMLNDRAWGLATDPDPSERDPARAVALAEEAITLPPNEVHVWNTLGVARYRAGDYQEALAALQKYRDQRIEKKGEWSNAFFLAMVHWRLGNKEEARQWYDMAVQSMEKTAPNASDLKRYRAEAAELLEVDPNNPPAPSTAPATSTLQSPEK